MSIPIVEGTINFPIVKKTGTFKSSARSSSPTRIILHHTAGGNLSGAVSTLKEKGFGYHYIIDSDATIIEFVDPMRTCSHAYMNNRGTIGISFVGGGTFGACNQGQFGAILSLMLELKRDYPSITEFTGHKHVDPRGWKIDPRWSGEPANGVDWDIDRKWMEFIAEKTGLTPIYKVSKYK